MAGEIDDRPFHLKQFSLHHHRSSMKVGTDSLLLGIWTMPENTHQILDIGSGCGILSLLMAARSSAQVDAIELDRASYEEASENFRNSPFNDRMNIFHEDFRIFARQSNRKYDLLISNPPFFINDKRASKQVRSNARHGDKLNYEELCSGAVRLMDTSGRLCLVLPYEESRTFVQIAEKHGLHIRKKMLVFPKRGWPPNRVNLELTFKKCREPVIERFIIREENNAFTRQYIDFFKRYLIGLDAPETGY
jgi:tRNA1Val (adenine37-N6)-methyltransferase